MLKAYSHFLAISYTIALTIISLVHLGKLPSVGVSFGDKIFHFVVYSGLTIIWYVALTYKYKFPFVKALMNAFIFAISFGMIIEVLQGTLATGRSLDFYDALANSLGALFALILIIVLRKRQFKN